MSHSLISIIVPVYNGEKYIEKCINSILNQTYTNLELIIINDGSNDNTEKKIKSFNDQRINYFYIDNSGVSVARNFGIEQATGEYIAFVDSDDYLDLDMYKILVKISKDSSSDLVSCSYEKKHSNKIVPEKTYLSQGYYNKKDIVNKIYPSLFEDRSLKPLIPLNIVTKLFKTKIIKDNNILFEPGLRYGEDLLFTQIYFLNIKSFYYLPDCYFYKYFNNKKSVTKSYDKHMWKNQKKGIHKRIELIKKIEEYDFYSQIPYKYVKSSMSALVNIGRNKDLNFNQTSEEIEKLLSDRELKYSINIIDTKEFSKIRKLFTYLIKNNQRLTIYSILKLYSLLSRILQF